MNLSDPKSKSPHFFNACSSASHIDGYRLGVENEKRTSGTVFIVDNNHTVRRQFERLINSKGWRVVSFDSAEEFLQEAVDVEAACLLLEANLPGLDGLGLQNRLLQQRVLLPIIFMAERADIRTAVRALEAGAVSFLLKPVDQMTLMAEVENAFAVWHDEFRQRVENATIQRLYSTLTTREREVFSCITRGDFAQKILDEPAGSVRETVEMQRRRVLKKMHARSEMELALMARRLNARSDYVSHSPPPSIALLESSRCEFPFLCQRVRFDVSAKSD